jgi:hypothetical protein
VNTTKIFGFHKSKEFLKQLRISYILAHSEENDTKNVPTASPLPMCMHVITPELVNIIMKFDIREILL